MLAQRQRFYNLPSDGHGYPKFTSFRERRDYIKSSIIFARQRIEFLQKLDVEDNKRAKKECQIPRAQRQPKEEDMANHQAEIEDEQSLDLQDLVEFLDSSRESEGNKNPFETISSFDDHMKRSNAVFVGDSTASFTPYRGDLIIYQPGKDQEPHGRGYIGSCEGPCTHILDGGLVVRIGQYDKARHSEDLFVHKPYETLELYKLNLDGTWQYLGSQARITNSEMAIDMSPGKYLNIGAQFCSSGKFHPLVPRRGDVIIKKEALSNTFSHEENFWHSMIKWHKGSKVALDLGDFLIRLFVDKERMLSYAYDADTTPEPGDHSGCVLHGECQESHPPLSSGFAELYQKGHDASGWTYWGRTKLLFDIVSQKQNNPHILFYTEDDGQYSGFDIEESSLQNPWLK